MWALLFCAFIGACVLLGSFLMIMRVAIPTIKDLVVDSVMDKRNNRIVEYGGIRFSMTVGRDHYGPYIVLIDTKNMKMLPKLRFKGKRTARNVYAWVNRIEKSFYACEPPFQLNYLNPEEVVI